MKNDFDLIVLGGSSGGIDAVLQIIKGLTPEFSLPIIVVMHQIRSSRSSLPEIIQSRTKLKVKEPEDKEKILLKHVYVAPPDYHIMVEKNGIISYNHDELVNHSRPAIDVLFEVAADIYENRLIGVLLTGSNADGANGIKMIKEKGGITIVQNPETAESPFMPIAAITKTKVDFILDLKEISIKLNKMDNGNK